MKTIEVEINGKDLQVHVLDDKAFNALNNSHRNVARKYGAECAVVRRITPDGAYEFLSSSGLTDDEATQLEDAIRKILP